MEEKKTFTFIEVAGNTMSEGAFCDPTTGICGPVLENAQEKQEDPKEVGKTNE